MTVLGVLAGFTAAVLVAVLIDLPSSSNWRKSVQAIAVGFFFISLVTEIAALLAYDRFYTRNWQAEPKPQAAHDS